MPAFEIYKARFLKKVRFLIAADVLRDEKCYLKISDSDVEYRMNQS